MIMIHHPKVVEVVVVVEGIVCLVIIQIATVIVLVLIFRVIVEV